ncbi:hypothetical protein [Portibacter lacus]|uniref:Uncharacterized protein n=1 Tax=Portibacter lacus TaxID=1099794 RepID=A0AA37SNW1_9BACT|nr:hypothetical protein [Portibacter lacus]GLR15993.1 hypothetical protein GCM10007940_06080 [Portibacter lacus]
MYIVDVKTQEHFDVDITSIESQDFKKITKKEYFFNWKLEKNYEINKLIRTDDSKILGLVSIERIPEEWRIHIRLLSVSVDNKGKQKSYERIVGNLLTFISKLAIKEFAELACVSLKPKSTIAQHYIKTYGMNVTGATLSLELPEILNLVKKYDNGK